MAGTVNTTARSTVNGRDVATWTLVLCALAAAGWIIAPMSGHPRLAWPALVAGLLAALSVAVHGARTVRRRNVVDQLQLALLAELGGRAGGVTVRARRWTRGWSGRPALVRLTYAPFPAALSPEWPSKVAQTTSSVLSGTYRTTKHDAGRGRLTLRLHTEPERVKDSVEVERARHLVTTLLGPTATVRKIDVDDHGQVRTLEVAHDVGAKLVPTGYRARIERTVSSLLPGRWRAVWDLEGDRVRFEVRPTLPDSIWLEEVSPPAEDLLERYGDVEIPFGVDEDGAVMSWRPAELPQAVVTGGTGTGKTSTTHALLVQFSHYGWPIWVADGKSIEFLGFRDWPNVQVVASTPPEQVAVIHRAWELMEHRYSLVTRNQARIEDFEPLLLFVDEYADLKGALTSWYSSVKQKGDPRQPATFDEVASIIRKGRTARVHVVLALQRPDAEFLGGEMRDNLGMRISVGRLSPQGAQMMWEHPGIGVTLPRGKRGRAIAAGESGQPVEMQCYRTPDPAKATSSVELELLARLRPAESHQERLLIIEPEPTTDLDSGEPVSPTFDEYARADWVRAADRPDLDPLSPNNIRAGLATGRELASPMAVLGLSGVSRPPGGRPRLEQLAVQLSSGGMSPEDSNDPAEDSQYGEPEPIAPTAVDVGDLLEVDGEWVVVEEQPIPDLEDPDAVSISWRDDNDNYGDLVVPADDLLQVRHPMNGA